MQTLGIALVLVLRTYDMVGMTPREGATAARAAVDVLRVAHIELSWLSCAPAGSTMPEACDTPPSSTDLIVRIVSGEGQPPAASLAEAYVDTHSLVGSLATVYIDRVRRLAEVAGVDAGMLMGRAIAHEIGHLLAGTSSHSRHGLMRPSWSAEALRHDHDRAWTFSAREAAQLRQRLAARADADVPRRVGLVEPCPPGTPPCPKGRLVCEHPVAVGEWP